MSDAQPWWQDKAMNDYLNEVRLHCDWCGEALFFDPDWQPDCKPTLCRVCQEIEDYEALTGNT